MTSIAKFNLEQTLEWKNSISAVLWIMGSIIVIAIIGSILLFSTHIEARTFNTQGADINLIGIFASTPLVFLLLIGTALRATGLTRRKNALKSMMIHMVAILASTLGFFFIGFAFQSGGYGHTAYLGGFPSLSNELTVHVGGHDLGFLGAQGFLLSGNSYDARIDFLFLFLVGTVALVAMIPLGAIGERLKLTAAFVSVLFISTILYPVFANWTWGGGWLTQLGAFHLGSGYIDYCGSGVVHALGGWIALAGVLVIRPRIRKFNMDETPNVIPAHNVIFVLLGTLLITAGWLGLIIGMTIINTGTLSVNIGSAGAVIFMSSTSGALISMLYCWLVKRPLTKSIATKGYPDPAMTANGFLGGLVAGSAGCLCVSPIGGLMIGAIAGLLVPVSITFFEERWLIDDVTGNIAIHGVCGIWGQIAVGIFANGTFVTNGHVVNGILMGDLSQLVAQGIGAITVFIWGFGGSFIFFNVFNRMFRLRVSSQMEMHGQGLDIIELGSPAYSDIKNHIHGRWPQIFEGSKAYQMSDDA